jgi:hypothetical protein
MKPIFIITLHPLLPNSQKIIDAYSPSKETLISVLYIEFDSSTGRFHTFQKFQNFQNYHEFSFSLNGGTMPS